MRRGSIIAVYTKNQLNSQKIY